STCRTRSARRCSPTGGRPDRPARIRSPARPVFRRVRRAVLSTTAPRTGRPTGFPSRDRYPPRPGVCCCRSTLGCRGRSPRGVSTTVSGPPRPRPAPTGPAGTRTSRGGTPAPSSGPAPARPPSGRPGQPGRHRQRPLTALRLRYYHLAQRRREVGARRHPVPRLVEVVFQPLLEHGDRDTVDSRRPPVRPYLLERLHKQTLVNIKRLRL